MVNVKYNVIVLLVMLVDERTVRGIGDSMYIALPPEWVRAHKVTKGTAVKVVVGEAIVVLPPRDYTSEEIDEIFSKSAVVTKAIL